MSRRLAPLALVVLVLAPRAGLRAQSVVWHQLVTVYADNTEFFTPYRIGETILGGQLTTWLRAAPTSRVAVDAGVFGDVRWGSDEFLDRVKPVLRVRYHRGSSTGVLGTLETTRRHGFLDPLQVSTLELTRPIEYGGQWIERRRLWQGEVFLNWQTLVTATQREVIDAGVILRVTPIPLLALDLQTHLHHRGGQLYQGDEPVANNRATAIGLTLAGGIPRLGRGSIGVARLLSSGSVEPAPTVSHPRRGRGILVRTGLSPRPRLELFGIWWRGRDFLSQEGDGNYNSVGWNPGFYRARRKYLELGARYHSAVRASIELDLEARLHRIDDAPSVAIQGTSWEYSYRVVARAPLQFTLKRR
jgi:hypothetical protein